MRPRSLGFTLLEILIVLMILGIIAGLAVPSFSSQLERGKAMEAMRQLDMTRQSLARYYVKNETYAGATIPPAGIQATIDFNPNETITGTNYFSYGFVGGGPAAGSYQIRATRQSFVGCGSSIGTITLDDDGTMTKTGVYV